MVCFLEVPVVVSVCKLIGSVAENVIVFFISYKYTSTRVHEYTSTRVHEYTSTRVHEYTSTRTHNYFAHVFLQMLLIRYAMQI